MTEVFGLNHVALDVPDVSRAVEFYTDVFDMEVLHSTPTSAWLDCRGRFDFLALFEDATVDPDQPKDGHWGLVVDELEPIRERARQWDVTFFEEFECDFRDPFGYRVQAIRLSDVSKPPTPYQRAEDDFEGML